MIHDFQWKQRVPDEGYSREMHLAMVNDAIVGTASLGIDEQTWWAFGCLHTWEDTPLGSWPTIDQAKASVEDWLTVKALRRGLPS